MIPFIEHLLCARHVASPFDVFPTGCFSAKGILSKLLNQEFYEDVFFISRWKIRNWISKKLHDLPKFMLLLNSVARIQTWVYLTPKLIQVSSNVSLEVPGLHFSPQTRNLQRFGGLANLEWNELTGCFFGFGTPLGKLKLITKSQNPDCQIPEHIMSFILLLPPPHTHTHLLSWDYPKEDG